LAARTLVSYSVVDLKPLHQVFDIQQPPRAELGIKGPPANEMPDLPFPHGAHGSDIEGMAAVDKFIAVSQDLLPHPSSGDRPQLDRAWRS
jgi:hypothetical protein